MSEYSLLTADTSIRLDMLLVKEWEHLERNQIQQMISSGHIHINDSRARKVAQKLEPGDIVKVILPVPEKINTHVYDSPLPVLYEDNHLLLIDKPAGLSLRKSTRTQPTTVASSISHLRPELANVGGVGHAGIVSALGDTASGLVLLAKDEETYSALRRHLKRHRIRYTFTAMVEGRLRGEDVIKEPIGNARHERQRLQVSREGRPAVTGFRSQRHFRDATQDYTLLMVTPESSRRHQIRIHLSWYGYPLVGDKLYGSRHQNLLQDRIFLHLGVIEFPDPYRDEIVHVESSLPLDLQSVLTYLARPKM